MLFRSDGADLLVGLLDIQPPAPSLRKSTHKAAPSRTAGGGTTEPRVTIAVRPGCPFSARALRMLRTLGIPHELIEPSSAGRVPQVFIDGHLIGGYDALAELHGRGELEPLRQR